jgi:hypothetical protein
VAGKPKGGVWAWRCVDEDFLAVPPPDAAGAAVSGLRPFGTQELTSFWSFPFSPTQDQDPFSKYLRLAPTAEGVVAGVADVPLRYHVDWPLNVILDEDILQGYEAVCRRDWVGRVGWEFGRGLYSNGVCSRQLPIPTLLSLDGGLRCLATSCVFEACNGCWGRLGISSRSVVCCVLAAHYFQLVNHTTLVR